MAKMDDFKSFVKKNPNLVNYVRNDTMSWQKFYELYDLYGEDENIWGEYLGSRNASSNKVEKKSTSRFSDILDMAKNIDANKLQDSISSVQKAIGLIGDMFIKDKGTDTNSYTPRPIYRKFDD
ncbi:MAG: spore coat protein YlbD [Bacilli bacterium]